MTTAKTAAKISLAPARPIPFNRLVLSQSNVRQVKAGASIEELAESIARRGLIQSLHVRPVLDGAGGETGMYEVPAGGRRYRALALLVGQKRLNKTSPIPCIVSEAGSGVLIEEISLAENVERAPLHPLDQFRAFQAMLAKGMTEEAIAAAFFIDVKVVKQRLRLAEVAPTLLDVYAADGMTLEQLMAFTVTSDHRRQEQVWAAVQGSWQKEPYTIRRMLTERSVPVGEKRAVFVGVKAYEAAGGTVLRDLFEADRGGWLQDVALLDCLAGEGLKAAAEAIAGEGWKWVEVAFGFPYDHDYGMRRLMGEPIAMSDEERATVDALTEEQERIVAEYEQAEELPEEADDRLGEIEAALEELADRPLRFDPAEIARAGAFVSIAHDGRLQVVRGRVRPEDEAPAEDLAQGQGGGSANDGVQDPAGSGEAARPTVQRAIIQLGGAPAASQPEPEEEDGIRPLPDRLMVELTGHRTMALRDAVANHPGVALTALLHKLVRDTFRYHTGQGCLEASVREVHFGFHNGELDGTPSARAVAERHAAWGQEMPRDEAELWDWIAGLDEASRMALLAHCVGFGVNALYERPNPYGGAGVSEHGLRQRLAGADRLARETGLDMAAAGWRPTVGNYLGRVTKARILEAVREGAGEDKARLIEGLKKGDMAREAERLLAETGWLPEPLRSADGVTPAPEEVEAGPTEADAGAAEIEALPDFLAGEGDDADHGDEAGAYDIAAE